ncbi:MAG: SPOR domain-containing protein [Pseudomonadales bacterium]
MDEGLKIRLVGAVVLLAILAIAWPFLFDSAEEIQLSKESQIPKPPAVQEWQAEQREKPDDNKIGWPNTADKPVNGNFEGEKQDVAPEAKIPSVDVDQTSPVLRDAWSVKVATLSDVANGNKLVEKLIKDGFRAYGRQGSGDEGPVMRVYVGPKFDKRRADSIKLKIDKQYSVKSLVVKYTPEET